MKVIEKAKTPEGYDIQIESWKEDYPTVFNTLGIGAYPKANKTSQSGWIEGNRIFRVDISRGFNNDEEVYEAFHSLTSGTKQIKDYAEQFWQLDHAQYL
jgi:hypothetical protein